MNDMTICKLIFKEEISKNIIFNLGYSRKLDKFIDNNDVGAIINVLINLATNVSPVKNDLETLLGSNIITKARNLLKSNGWDITTNWVDRAGTRVIYPYLKISLLTQSNKLVVCKETSFTNDKYAKACEKWFSKEEGN